jgi:hypothetical protein
MPKTTISGPHIPGLPASKVRNRLSFKLAADIYDKGNSGITLRVRPNPTPRLPPPSSLVPAPIDPSLSPTTHTVDTSSTTQAAHEAQSPHTGLQAPPREPIQITQSTGARTPHRGHPGALLHQPMPVTSPASGKPNKSPLAGATNPPSPTAGATTPSEQQVTEETTAPRPRKRRTLPWKLHSTAPENDTAQSSTEVEPLTHTANTALSFLGVEYEEHYVYERRSTKRTRRIGPITPRTERSYNNRSSQRDNPAPVDNMSLDDSEMDGVPYTPVAPRNQAYDETGRPPRSVYPEIQTSPRPYYKEITPTNDVPSIASTSDIQTQINTLGSLLTQLAPTDHDVMDYQVELQALLSQMKPIQTPYAKQQKTTNQTRLRSLLSQARAYLPRLIDGHLLIMLFDHYTLLMDVRNRFISNAHLTPIHLESPPGHNIKLIEDAKASIMQFAQGKKTLHGQPIPR